MALKSVLMFFSLTFVLPALAQDISDEMCREALLTAETKRNPAIYSQCGFDDMHQAIMKWAPWAESNNAYQAMYELCIRYSDLNEGPELCQKAILGGNGPALVLQGNDFYAQKNYIKALESYMLALKTPLLTEEEKGQISENIAVLYLDKNSAYYNPAQGVPLAEKATQQRSALANNIMGVYSMVGLHGQPVNMEKAFEYLWRSVLLGCPNAEENLGLFYLLYQKKLTASDVAKLVEKKILTCQTENDIQNPVVEQKPPQNCDCEKAFQMEQLVKRHPYRLILTDGDKAVVMDANKRRYTVTLETALPDASVVKEIRKSAVILLKNRTRLVLNLAPDEACIDYCTNKEDNLAVQSDVPNIKPYHLTFTPSECSSILYYAERLVDTNLPFVGKKECGHSDDLGDATKLLLQ